MIWVNVRGTALKPQEKPRAEGIYKSSGFHKAFNKRGLPLLVKIVKKRVYIKL